MSTSVPVAIITGANSGIGYETTLGLAKKGFKVVLICRNKEKGEKAIKDMKKECSEDLYSNDFSGDLIIADLSSFESVRNCVKEFKIKYNKLDVLVCNAGVGFFEKRTLTEDEQEITFQVKYLSHALLVLSLYDLLKTSKDGRIVMVSGMLHNHPVNVDDLILDKKYNANNAIGHVNLAIIMFVYFFSRKIKDVKNVKITTVHPGLVNTGMMDSFPTVIKLMSNLTKPFQHSPKSGAEPLILLATDPNIESGRYYNRKKAANSNKKLSYNVEVQEALWKKTLEILKFKEEEIFETVWDPTLGPDFGVGKKNQEEEVEGEN